MEEALKKYGMCMESILRQSVFDPVPTINCCETGDVVRIAPNELLFVRPRALAGKRLLPLPSLR